MVEATLSSTFHSNNDAAAASDGAIVPKEKETSSSTSAIFQDAITVEIPIDATVDLGIALRRTRAKRIEALYEAFPSLKEKDESDEDDDDEDEDEDDEEGEADSDAEMEGGENSGDGGEGTRKKKKKLKKEKQQLKNSGGSGLVPQRHEFGTIMDYLEAKYVRGVMIQNDEDENRSKKKMKEGDEEGGEDGEDETSKRKAKEEDEDDEGQGSVYSESSFLDDRDLQRDVAEQVLAQTTTTKLALEGEDDFFVNVGDLDVEETELTQQHYDPLEDCPNKKKSKPASKKRKKPSAGTAVEAKKAASALPAKKKTAISKKKKEDDKGGSNTNSSKKKKPEKKKMKVSTKKPKLKEPEKEKEDNDSDSSSEGAVAVAAASKKAPKKNTDEMKVLKGDADKYGAIMTKRFDTVKKMIKELTKDQLPRRPPLKSKVSITCPANKKEGDEVTFANPHIPGQRLRVPVPKGTFAGETFKVTVPVPKPAPGDEDEGTDHNKFPRDLQDELDMYAREYDDFCKHEGEYRHAKNEEYPIHLEKRKKYDQVVKEFPKNLMTTIDAEYMKKLVRRARQNKSKRSKSAAVRRQSGDPAVASPTTGRAATPPVPAQTISSQTTEKQQPQLPPPPQLPSDHELQETAENSADEEEEQPPPEVLTHRTLHLPERGLSFPERRYRTIDFFQAGGAN